MLTTQQLFYRVFCCGLSHAAVQKWKVASEKKNSTLLQIPDSNSLISCNNRKNTNSFMSNSYDRLLLSKSNWNPRSPVPSSSVPLHPHSHLPTLPSLWSVLGSAMMAWTATMASLILVWSSLSSSMCSRRRIWAASFRVASEEKFILLCHPWLISASPQKSLR